MYELTREDQLADMLRRCGIPLRDGMSRQQLEQAQQRYEVRFPPDYAQILASFVPGGQRFYNWDDESPENITMIKRALDWPTESILFDVENNGFWRPDWGERPAQMEDALHVAGCYLEDAPELIPIRGHRYLPSKPFESDNPVLSVYQTDIIYYGSNLFEFFAVELGVKPHKDICFAKIKRGIPFWGWFLE